MKYQIDDQKIVDTDKALAHWSEKRDSNGSNLIGRATHSQWDYQDLYKSRKGRYYLVHSSARQGDRDHVEWIEPKQAAAWLALMDEELPDDLKEFEDEVVE